MRILLTSTFSDYRIEDGREVPSPIIERFGQLDAFRSVWCRNARVLIIASDPDDVCECDRVMERMRESFLMSGLDVGRIAICDRRQPSAVDNLGEVDVLVLAGGHVPTQNAFIKKIGLREKLKSFRGSVVALSAGSMNCADTVYAIPELDGEAIDPAYKRWLSGLGLTDINIFPHFQYLRGVTVDGLRMAEDIAFPDSMGREIVALNDGSYIMISDGRATVYGEAYMIKDGGITPIPHGSSL